MAKHCEDKSLALYNLRGLLSAARDVIDDSRVGESRSSVDNELLSYLEVAIEDAEAHLKSLSERNFLTGHARAVDPAEAKAGDFVLQEGRLYRVEYSQSGVLYSKRQFRNGKEAADYYRIYQPIKKSPARS